jgi:hypothetical protein
LYLNMVFTVAAAFAGGLMPGLITVVLSTIAYGFGYTYWGSGFSVFAAPP